MGCEIPASASDDRPPSVVKAKLKDRDGRAILRESRATVPYPPAVEALPKIMRSTPHPLTIETDDRQPASDRP
jgi:hypothetical protein